LLLADIIFNEEDFGVNKAEPELTASMEVIVQEENPIEDNSQQMPVHQSNCQRNPLVRFRTDDYVEATIVREPESIEEALGSVHWSGAANSEYECLMENNTWELVNLPEGRKTIECK
jgi:hypothetical protein